MSGEKRRSKSGEPWGPSSAADSDAAVQSGGTESNPQLQRHLPSILRGADIFVWLWNVPAGTMREVSGDDERLSDFGGKSTVSLQFWIDRLDPEDAGIGLAFLERLRDGDRGVIEAEIRFRTLKAECRWSHARGQVIEWTADGAPRLAVITSRDITGQKTAERRLEESERRFRGIVEASPLGTVTCSLDAAGRFTITGCNPAASRILGVDGSAYVGKSVLEMLPDIPEARLEAYRDVCRNQGCFHSSDYSYRDGRVEGTFDLIAFPIGQDALGVVFSDVSEQKQTLAALKERERKYHAILHQSFQSSVLLSPEGEVLEANQRALQVTGLTHRETIGRKIWEAPCWNHAPDCEPRLREAIHGAAGGEFIRLEMGFRNLKGDLRVADLSFKPILDDDGAPLWLLFEGRDITELREAERKEQEQQRFLRDVMDASPGVVFRYVLHPDGARRFAFISQGISAAAGLNAEKVMADPSEMWRRLHPEDFTDLRNTLVSSVETLAPIRFTFRLYGDDGVMFWIRFTAVTKREDDGSVVWNGTATDVTSYKEIEDRLRDNEYRFRTLLGGTFNGICIHEDGVVLEANQGMQHMFGYGPEELSGRDVMTLVAPESHRLLQDNPFVQRLTPCEVVGRRKDGTTFPLQVQAKSIPYRGRSVWVAELRDLTEQRRADEALRDSEARYRTLVENAPEAILVVDGDANRIVDFNLNALALFGYSAEEMQQLSPEDLSLSRLPDGKESAEDFRLSQKRVLAGEVLDFERSLKRQGGNEFFADVRLVRLPSKDRNLVRASITDITERKHAEQRLRQREYEYQVLFESSGDAILLMEDGCFRHCNLKAVELFGLPRAELCHRRPEDLSPPEQPDGENSAEKAARLIEAAKAEHHQAFEWRHRRSDGTEFDAEVTLTAVQVGGTGLVQSVIRDITLRKQTEQELRFRSEFEALVSTVSARLLSLAPSAADMCDESALAEICQFIHADGGAVFLFSDDLRHAALAHLWTNGAFEIGKEGLSRIPIEPSRECLATLADGQVQSVPDIDHFSETAGLLIPTLQSNGVGAHVQVPMVSLDRIIGCLVFGSRQRIRQWTKDDLAVLKVAGQIFTTAFHRRMADSALQASERNYRELVQNASSIILRMNTSGQITFLNRFGLEFFGFKSQEILGRNIAGTIFPAGEHGFDASGRLIRSARRNPLDPEALETENVRLGGERVRVAWTSKAILDTDGNILEILCIGNDVTEMRRLEEQFRQVQKMEAVGRLAGGVAHDFNNLLTVINGYTDLTLKKIAKDDPLQRNLVEIRKAGERAGSLTQQLLAFSRRQVSMPRPTNVSAVVNDLTGMLLRLVGEDVQIEARLESPLPLVKLDAGQLNQVLINLVVNARDAMPSGGRLTIATVAAEVRLGHSADLGIPPGRYVVLSVADTGVGIDEETRLHIFEPFYTTKGSSEGTGLGLSTVYGIVKQHGGHIRVETSVGSGSTFLIYFPVSGEPAEDETTGVGHTEELQGAGTILVVEDQEEVRRLACEVLRDFGYTVLEAAGGEEGLRLAASHQDPIHLLLTDIVMPGKSGHVFAREFLAMRPLTKVIFMSGYAADMKASSDLLASGADFLQKPFSPEALGEKVRSSLSTPSRSFTILVVDDEPAIRSFIRHTLAGSGFKVVEACNGKEALACVGRQKFDLVITDLVMPEKEGIETIRELNRLHPGMKIIAVSGAFGGQYVKIAAHLGAKGTLVKPFTAQKLMEAVHNVLKEI